MICPLGSHEFSIQHGPFSIKRLLESTRIGFVLRLSSFKVDQWSLHLCRKISTSIYRISQSPLTGMITLQVANMSHFWKKGKSSSQTCFFLSDIKLVPRRGCIAWIGLKKKIHLPTFSGFATPLSSSHIFRPKPKKTLQSWLVNLPPPLTYQPLKWGLTKALLWETKH